jgi:hypothetical protein
MENTNAKKENVEKRRVLGSMGMISAERIYRF